MLVGRPFYINVIPLLYRHNAEKVRCNSHLEQRALNYISQYGYRGDRLSALTWAVVHGQKETVRRVLEFSDNIVQRPHKFLALHHGHSDIAKMFVDTASPQERFDGDGREDCS